MYFNSSFRRVIFPKTSSSRPISNLATNGTVASLNPKYFNFFGNNVSSLRKFSFIPENNRININNKLPFTPSYSLLQSSNLKQFPKEPFLNKGIFPFHGVQQNNLFFQGNEMNKVSLNFEDKKEDNQSKLSVFGILPSMHEIIEPERQNSFFELPSLGESGELSAVKRTYKPSQLRRRRRHGLEKRLSTKPGRKILHRRIRKGRWYLTV